MFLFSLARELHMTVRQLLVNLDSYEISEWAAFFKLERERTEQGSGGSEGDDLSEQIKAAFSTLPRA